MVEAQRRGDPDHDGAPVNAPDTTPEPELNAENVIALLDELSRRMREAAAEVRPASFELKGCRVWAEWPEEKSQD